MYAPRWVTTQEPSFPRAAQRDAPLLAAESRNDSKILHQMSPRRLRVSPSEDKG